MFYLSCTSQHTTFKATMNQTVTNQLIRGQSSKQRNDKNNGNITQKYYADAMPGEIILISRGHCGSISIEEIAFEHLPLMLEVTVWGNDVWKYLRRK